MDTDCHTYNAQQDISEISQDMQYCGLEKGARAHVKHARTRRY